MIPAPRTNAVGGIRLLLLVAALLAALGGGLGPAAAQEEKPYAPAAPAAPAERAPAPPEPKSLPGVTEEDQTPSALSAIQSAVSPLETISCSAPQQSVVNVSSTDFTSLGSCLLTVPVTTTVYLNANATATLGAASAFEALFTFTVDGNTLFSPRRWVNVYPDGGDGTDETVALSRMLVVGPGPHIFGLQVSKTSSNDGNIKVYSPVLTALAIPPTSGLSTCGASDSSWNDSTNTITEIISCTITTSVTGTVYLDANASLTLPFDGASYEAQFRFGLNDTDLPAPSRWVNISTDSGDGTDRSLSLSRMLVVGPGTHTFRLMGRRASAAVATVRAVDPQLSAIFIPTGSPAAQTCDGTIQDFSNSTNTYQSASSCQLTVAVTSTVFLHASASVALPNGGPDYEGVFRFGLNSSDLAPPTRYVNIYANSDDGTDKTVALSRMLVVGPGTHTFRLMARLLAEGGQLKLYSAGMSAVVLNNLPDPVYVPAVVKQ